MKQLKISVLLFVFIGLAACGKSESEATSGTPEAQQQLHLQRQLATLSRL